MSLEMTSLRNGRSVGWSRILGLILVPLTVAGVLLWGLWNPQERLDTVTAAVVNLDEAVEIDGQHVPLGRVLASELIAGDADQNFTWVLTDEADGEEGLADGRYTTVVTIPENFSAAATSLSEDPTTAVRATIDIAESDSGRLIDTALSNIVTSTATSVINQQLGEQFVSGVFVGMSELGKGIGEAADGATELATGASELADGTSQLAEGTTQLATGTQELATGVGALSSGASELSAGTQELAAGTGALSGGASQLSAGTQELAAGTGALSDGASQLAGGASQLSTGANELASGAQGLAGGMRLLATGDGGENPGLAGLAAGTEEYVGGVNLALTGLQGAATGAIEPLSQYRDAILAGLIPLPPEADQDAVVAGLNQLIDGFVAAAADDGDIAHLQAAGPELAAGVRASAAGADQLASGAEALAGGATDLATGATGLSAGAADLSSGTSQLAGGVGQLASGAAELSSGTSQLAGGVGQLAAGTSELASGTGQLVTGTTELASGAGELATGTTELATGTTALADGAGSLASGLDEAAANVPNYTESERTKIAETALAPVEAQGGSDELFNSSGVPLFAGIAMWAGALAAFLMLAPLWRRTRDAARGVGAITLRSALPAVLLGAVQGMLAGIILPIAFGYDFAQGARFFAVALLAGIAFMLVVQGLSALLGGVGRFIAFVLLVVAFAAGIVSTAPAALSAIGDASPIGTALAGFQSVANGAAAGGTMVVLILWGLAGLVLTALAVGRARRAR